MITPAEMDAWVRDYEARDPAAWLVDFDADAAMRLARKRNEWAGSKRDHRSLMADPLEAHRIGASGEFAFAARFNLPPPVFHPGSDGGIDFRVPFTNRAATFDVKTRGKQPADLLMVPVDGITKGSADFLVLSLLCDGRIQFLGWEHKSIMALMPPREFGFNRPTYARPVNQLRPMYQLDYLLGLRQS